MRSKKLKLSVRFCKDDIEWIRDQGWPLGSTLRAMVHADIIARTRTSPPIQKQ